MKILKMVWMCIKDFGDEAIVCNISIPEEYRGIGLSKLIYQSVSNLINKPIVNSLKYKDKLGIHYVQSQSGGMYMEK